MLFCNNRKINADLSKSDAKIQSRNKNQGYYKSFQPHPINKQWELQDMELLDLLSKADRHLGRLDMYSEHIPDIDLFISMHVVKEATQSSRIEGTQTNIEEALFEKENVNPEKKDDWEEVQNYIAAMNQAIAMLEDIPFSSRSLHRIIPIRDLAFFSSIFRYKYIG